MIAGTGNALARDLSWVLVPLLELSGVRHGVVLTSDGLVAGTSPGLSREAGEGASAMMSSLIGSARVLVRELSQQPDAQVEQIVVAAAGGFVFAVPAGRNTLLALFADGDADLEIVAHHVQIQVRMLGPKVMGSQARYPEP